MGVFAVLAVAMLMATAVSPSASDGTTGDSDASEVKNDWKCVITVNRNDLSVKYAKAGEELSDTEPVRGNNGNPTVGSWGFDIDGYGPFGSFYAAFNVSDGEMYAHLNPDNLMETIDGESIAENKSSYNIMWCLPTVWMAVGSDGTLTMSGAKFAGATAPAHTVITGTDASGNSITKTYSYLGIGVYETGSGTGALGSISGGSGGNDTMESYIKRVGKAKVVDGVPMLWNFYQWQLYRFCSFAVIESFDAQTQIGNGLVHVYSGRQSAGANDSNGPYYGTKSSGQVAKLFIEDAWGNSADVLGDTYWEYKDGKGTLYVGQNAEQKADATGLTATDIVPTHEKDMGSRKTSELVSWGLCINGDSTQRGNLNQMSSSVAVGNDSYSAEQGNITGLSDMWFKWVSSQSEEGYFNASGTRLAFLFGSDPKAEHSVLYEMDGGTPQIESMKVQQGQEFTISATIPKKEGFSFGGWYDGKTMHDPGDGMTMGFNVIVLTAIWGHTVTFDLEGGEWDRSDMDSVTGRSYTVPDASPTKSGFTFEGWKYGDVVFRPGDTINLDSNIILVAVWTESSSGDKAVPIIPIIPDDGEDGVEIVVAEEGSEPWLGKNGKSLLLIAVVAAIIAELAVLTISRKR